MPHTSTVAEPKPPRAQQVSASATSRNLRDRPVRTKNVTRQDEQGHRRQREMVNTAEQRFAHDAKGQGLRHIQNADRRHTDTGPDRHAQRDQHEKDDQRQVEIPAQFDRKLFQCPLHSGPLSRTVFSPVNGGSSRRSVPMSRQMDCSNRAVTMLKPIGTASRK